MTNYRVRYKVLNGVEVTNPATGVLETRDQLVETSPMTIERAQQVMASLNLDDEVEDIELVKA